MKYLVVWTGGSGPHYFGTDDRSKATAKFDEWVEQIGKDPTKGFCLLLNFTRTSIDTKKLEAKLKAND